MEEINCRCCEDIAFWQKTKSDYQNYSLLAKVVRYGWKKGKKKIIDFEDTRIYSEPYPLKYCPQCGRKVEKTNGK